jgi:hypothetical protein
VEKRKISLINAVIVLAILGLLSAGYACGKRMAFSENADPESKVAQS